MSSLNSSDDAELMCRFVEGEDGTFEILVVRYEKPLLNFFFRLTRNRQAAEDLVQETFLRIVRARDSYTVKATFRTYMYRIARNLWIDRYRSARIRPRKVSLDEKGRNGAEQPISARLEGNEPAPGEKIEKDETLRSLARAVETLSTAQKEVFALWLETGMKYADISKTLGIPVGTIKSRMHMAVKKLKETMNKPLGEK
jgi:RNA polymerase sigma-70 factor, ECF subfamily